VLRGLPLWFLAALVCGCPAVDHDGPWGDVDEGRDATLNAELEQARQEQDLPGLGMAVAFHDDHTLWSSGTGWADVQAEIPWDSGHTSRMGSVTKTFTAAIVHQLIDEEALALEDLVADITGAPWAGVSVQHLLSQSSGIVSYNYVGNFDTLRAWTPSELVQWAYDQEPELRFEPGTRWEYSNTNYVLLGQIIEAVTGSTYDDEVQTRLLDPLGLDSIWLSGSGETLNDELVRCYNEEGVDTSDVDPSLGWAAGSLVGTPADIAKWNDALYFGRVLSDAALERMVTPLGLTGDDESPYGMGAFREGAGDEVTMGHSGGIAGYMTYAYTLENPPATVVVMANRLGSDLRAAARYGWAVVLGVDYP